MKLSFIRLLSGGLMSLAVGIVFLQFTAAGQSVPSALTVLARQAVSENPTKSAAAIKALREAGPAGMEALSEICAGEIAMHQRTVTGASAKLDERWARMCAAFDAVGQQRDDYASRLYWFTNLDDAKVAARAAGKPILSLRLLGKLNEEYSCANSRFFRTTLYPDADVSQYLRDHFILHWQSVRPVPRITIDMGDGRKIERTITGNSIHYILDSAGRPVDALPGLYGAKAFLVGLERVRAAAQQVAGLDDPQRIAFLQQYHSGELTRIEQEWAGDLGRIGPEPSNGAGAGPADWRQLDESTHDDAWRQIAALHAEDVRLDQDALALIRAKQPTMADAMRLAFTKGIVETPMMRTIKNLRRSIAEDTVRNEYELHAHLHQWFVWGIAPLSLDALNSKVYAEIFLTPDSDPWLGLAPADVYSALDHGGLVQNNPSTEPKP